MRMTRKLGFMRALVMPFGTLWASNVTTPIGRGDDTASSCRNRSEQQDSSRDQDCPGRPRDAFTSWKHLLGERVSRESGDPVQIHDAADEEQRHHHPAAANAIRAVLGSHDERSERTAASMRREKTHRRTTMTQ